MELVIQKINTSAARYQLSGHADISAIDGRMKGRPARFFVLPIQLDVSRQGADRPKVA